MIWYSWEGDPQSIKILSEVAFYTEHRNVEPFNRSGFKCASRDPSVFRECFICLHYQDLEDISKWESEGGSCVATF